MEEIITKDVTNLLSNINLEELFTYFSQSIVELGAKIIFAILIYLLGRWIVRKINSLVKKIMKKSGVDPSLYSFVKSLISIFLNVTLILLIISILGIQTSSFIALLGSIGLAFGMALSGTLQNFAGGVMILLFKPYKVGDFIEAQGQMGTVKEIKIFNTVLITPDNKTIIIPNSGISSGIMTNYSTTGTRRIEWKFNVAYGDSYDRAKSIIENLLNEDVRIKTDPAYLVTIFELNDSTINIVVRAWVEYAVFWDLYFEMNEKVFKAFEKEGVAFPLPQMMVKINS